MKRKSKKISWEGAPDIKKRVLHLLKKTEINWIRSQRIFTYRSHSSKTRAYARTWGLPSLWQRTLDVAPAYIIEVISEHFDKLSEIEQDKVLLHEIMHIPKNFSGALVPHTHRRKGSFYHKLDKLIEKYFENDTL